MFKKVSEKDVTDKFVQLIEENGSTTTMDVKKALRNDGFWVFQKTVSAILGETFIGLGMTREFNGHYCVYSKAEAQIDDEYTSTDTEDVDVEDVDTDNSAKRAKVITDIQMVADDIYQLSILANGNTVDLFVSTDLIINLSNELAYRVYDNKGREWFLYTSNKDVITRHRAIYYVWLVASREYDGFVKYSELRSKRMW